MDELRSTVTEEEYAHIIVKPIAGTLGAEVDGVALPSQPSTKFMRLGFAIWLSCSTINISRLSNNSNLPAGLATFITIPIWAGA